LTDDESGHYRESAPISGPPVPLPGHEIAVATVGAGRRRAIEKKQRRLSGDRSSG
jgi:hypothetical protein